jgi:hypothetical protein
LVTHTPTTHTNLNTPVAGLFVEQPLEERLEAGADVGGELDGVLDDVVDEGVDGIGVEGRLADVELVQDDAQRPEVDLAAAGCVCVCVEARSAWGGVGVQWLAL